ncbi:MAG: hypothetical protein QNJ98_12170 [Planctomycetota bacterium]|nr:hypothetical protein [Planctomycetota bacterium]
MPWIHALPDRLKKLFTEGFSVMDLAEPLVSFDADRPAADVRAFLEARDFDVAGVRVGGLVGGYVERADLEGGTCLEHLKAFGADDVLAESTPMLETLRAVDSRGACFVGAVDQVGWIVTKSDFEKPALRMWLFGMITIVESKLTEEIRKRFEGDAWKAQISEGRRGHVERIAEERRRRGHMVEEIDCLQFGDKVHIVLRLEKVREQMGLPSREAGQRAFRRVESLRNDLAHGQALLTNAWDTILDLVHRAERLLA